MMGCDCIGTMKAAEDCTAYDPITRGVYEGLCHECAHKMSCHPSRLLDTWREKEARKG